MYAYGIGDLEKVMRIPVPFRKWLIDRWNKQKEKEQNSSNSDTNKPLSDAERIKFLKKAQQNPSKNSVNNLLQGVRNAPK